MCDTKVVKEKEKKKKKEVTTRAAVGRKLFAPIEIVTVRLKLPLPPGAVLIQMQAAGICHSDAQSVTGDFPMTPLPMILGHEGAGTVLETGPNVTGLAPGDAIALLGRPGCGRCGSCSSGRPAVCEFSLVPVLPGILDPPELVPAGYLGTVSERMIVPDASCFLAPDVPVEVRALYGCLLGTGYGAVIANGETRPGTRALVVGVGGVGLSVVMFLKAVGATTIVACDRHARRSKLAYSMGATQFVALKETADPLAARQEIIDASPKEIFAGPVGGFDVSFECSGTEFGQITAIGAVRSTGTTVLVGLTPWFKQSRTPMSLQVVLERNIVTTFGPGGNFRRAAERITRMYRAGILPAEKLVAEKRYSLDQINEVFKDMTTGKIDGRALVMFSPTPRM